MREGFSSWTMALERRKRREKLGAGFCLLLGRAVSDSVRTLAVVNGENTDLCHRIRRLLPHI